MGSNLGPVATGEFLRDVEERVLQITEIIKLGFLDRMSNPMLKQTHSCQYRIDGETVTAFNIPR